MSIGNCRICAAQRFDQPLGGQLPGVQGFVEVVAVAAHLDEQAPGGEVLIVKAVARKIGAAKFIKK